MHCERLPYPVTNLGDGHWPFQVSHHPGASALYSWRFAIAPMITSWWGSGGYGDYFVHSWDSPENEEIRRVASPFAYEGEFGGYRTKSPTASETCIFAITGAGTSFGDGVQVPKSLRDLDDDTVLCVEIRNSKLHWMAPGDFDIRTMPTTSQCVRRTRDLQPVQKRFSCSVRRRFRLVPIK